MSWWPGSGSSSLAPKNGRPLVGLGVPEWPPGKPPRRQVLGAAGGQQPEQDHRCGDEGAHAECVPDAGETATAQGLRSPGVLQTDPIVQSPVLPTLGAMSETSPSLPAGSLRPRE